MANSITRTLPALIVLLVTAAATTGAGQERKYTAPRTEGGRPDLQGVWNFNSRVPLQRPAILPADKKRFTKEEAETFQARRRKAFAAIGTFAPVEDVGLDWVQNTVYIEDLRTSLITYPETGRLPALVQGVRRMPGVEDFLAFLADAKGPPPKFDALLAAFAGGKRESYTDFPPSARCLIGADVPFLPQLDDNYVQIIQSRDSVAIVTDFDRRVVALDARPLAGDAVRTWAGLSRGHWEGETLVVETRNFDGHAQSFAGAGNSRDKVVTERFTRTAKDVMEYSATVVDPKTFQDRVEVSFPMKQVDDRIHEGTCHEGNYSLRHALATARLEEATKK